MNPKVTIVTVTYNLFDANRKETFIQCLESVHNQEYDNIEHLIIDGASNDGSLDLIKEYAKKGWIKYISEPDTGIYNAMNKGIKHATGKYVAFLNSDDFYHDTMGVSETIKALEENNADMSYADIKVINEENNTEHVFQGNKEYVFFNMPFSHQSAFAKKTLLEELGGFDETFIGAADYDLIMRAILNKNRLVKVLLNFITFRIGGWSTENADLSRKEVMLIMQKNFSKYTKITPKDCDRMFFDKIMPMKLYLKMKKEKFDIENKYKRRNSLYSKSFFSQILKYLIYTIPFMRKMKKIRRSIMSFKTGKRSRFSILNILLYCSFNRQQPIRAYEKD